MSDRYIYPREDPIKRYDPSDGCEWNDDEYEYKVRKVIEFIEKQYPDDIKLQGSLIFSLISFFNVKRITAEIDKNGRNADFHKVLTGLYDVCDVLAGNIKTTLDQARDLKEYLDDHKELK